MATFLAIHKLDPTEKRLPDVVGSDVTVEIPEQLVMQLTLKDLFTWLKDNPEFIMMLLTALLALFSSKPSPPKAP